MNKIQCNSLFFRKNHKLILNGPTRSEVWNIQQNNNKIKRNMQKHRLKNCPNVYKIVRKSNK